MMNDDGRNLPAVPQPAPLIAWPVMQRAAVITGITAAELVLFSVIVSAPWGPGFEIALIVATVFSVSGAGVGALFARRSKNPVAALESELKQAIQLMERRLISEDEYQAIKMRLISNIQPATGNRARVALRAGLWSGLVGLTLAQLGLALGNVGPAIPIILSTIAAGVAGTLLGGVTSAGLQVLRYRVENYRMLPAPPVGPTQPRLADPASADRPLLEG